jgi:hypothetical protein
MNAPIKPADSERQDAESQGSPPVIARNAEKNKIGAIILAVLSLIGFLSPNDMLARAAFLGGGIALLLRAFRSPLSIGCGLATWFGGAFLAQAGLGVWMIALSIAHGAFGMGFQEALVLTIGGSLAAFFLLRYGFKHSSSSVTGAAQTTSDVQPQAGKPEYNGPRCVSCRAPIQLGSKICPQCGWTQP